MSHQKSQIRTYKDLVAEREQLEAQLMMRKQKLREDWSGLKEHFTPVGRLLRTLSWGLRPDRSSPLLNKTLGVAVDLLVSKFVLGRAGWLTRLTVPFVLRNYSSHLFAEKGADALSKLGRILRRRRKRPATSPEPGQPGASRPDSDSGFGSASSGAASGSPHGERL